MGPLTPPVHSIDDHIRSVTEAEATLKQLRNVRHSRRFSWLALASAVAALAFAAYRVFAHEPPRDVVVPPMPKSTWAAGPLKTQSVVPAPATEEEGSPFTIGQRVQMAPGVQLEIIRFGWNKNATSPTSGMRIYSREREQHLRTVILRLLPSANVLLNDQLERPMFEASEFQLIGMLKQPGTKLIETHPTKDATTNDAETREFIDAGGLPPTWQPNGKDWEYTGRERITGAYWKKLTDEGLRLRPGVPFITR